MKSLEKAVAEKLLRIKAVKLQPRNPFTWASGWKSPIYCDNRKTLSYPQIRTFIKIEISRLILELYPDVEVIAGVATGAIAQGALTEAQYKNQMAQAVKTAAETNGIRINNKISEQTADSLIYANIQSNVS